MQQRADGAASLAPVHPLPACRIVWLKPFSNGSCLFPDLLPGGEGSLTSKAS
jgi:hypothetical protein